MSVPIYHAWDDLRFPLTRSQQGILQKPDYDPTNMGLLFPQNDATEIAYITAQLPHGWKLESELRPHIHWKQSQASVATWKMDYRVLEQGGDPDVAFTTLTRDSEAFTYTSGDLLQISSFPAIDMSGIASISAIVDIKLYRDDNVVTGDVLGKEFDIHVLSQQPGSRQEFIL
jgi:hypothetical protein